MTKTFNEFIKFIDRPQLSEYILTEVVNTKDEHLGWISFYPKWKKYVFNSSHKDTVYDDKCLEDIASRVWATNQK